MTHALPTYAVLGACDLASLRVASLLRFRGARLVLAGPACESLEVSARALGAHAAATSPGDGPGLLAALEEGREVFGSLDGVVLAPGGDLPAGLSVLDAESRHRWIAETLLSAHAGLEAVAGAAASGPAFPAVLVVPRAPTRLEAPLRAVRTALLGALREAQDGQPPDGVVFNAVDPGLAEPEFGAPIRRSRSVLRELAHTVAWLLDPDRTWIRGEVFGVDGRWTDSMQAS